MSKLRSLLERSQRRLQAFLDRGRREARAFVRDDVLGIDEWRSNWFGALRGKGRVLGTGWRSVNGLFAGAVSDIGALARGAFGRHIVPPLPSQATDPAERFQVAQWFYDRSDDFLTTAQAGTHRYFLLYLAALIALLAIAVGSVGGGHVTGLLEWISFLGCFAAVPAFGALAIRAAFYNFQLRKRRLDSFASWLRQPGEWWTEAPEGASPLSGAGPATLVLLISGATAAMMLGNPTAAVAAATNAEPVVSGNIIMALFRALNTNDLWYQLLTFVFPGVGPVGGTVTPLANGIASGFSVFIAVLMALSAAMMSYHTIIGIVATAHEGKVLGQRWHQVWAPMRVAYGTAALAPVAKGYCLLQVLVVWTALIGGQFGNLVWSGFLDGLSGAKISNPALHETIPLVRDAMFLEVCFEAVRRESANVSSGVPASEWPREPTPGPMTLTNNGIYRGASQLWHDAVSLWDSTITAGTQQPVAVQDLVWDYGVCGSIRVGSSKESPAADRNVLNLDEARNAALDSLRAELRTIAQRMMTSAGPVAVNLSNEERANEIFQQVLLTKAHYDSALTTAVQTYVDSVNKISMTEFKATAGTAGWASVGSYYMTLSRISAQVMSLVGVVPEVTFGSTGSQYKDGVGTDRLLGHELTGVLPNLRSWWDKQLLTTTSLSTSAARAGQFDNSGSVAGIMQWLGSSDSALQKWMIGLAVLKPGTGQALQHMVDFGHLILNAAFMILAALGIGGALVSKLPIAGAAAEAASNFVGKLMPSGAGKLTGFAATFFGLIAVGLLLAAVFHAFVLPMMPFIHFLYAVMGMLILVIEGVIAAPLWAFMHIRMDGAEFLDGPQKAGYGIVFNLLFRIPLTLFGLFFSILVFEAMVWFLSKTVYAAMASATTGNTVGLIGVITYVILISVLNYQLAIRSFNLISQVPDRVARWFGAQPDGDGEHHQAASAVGFVGTHTENTMKMGVDAGKAAFFATPSDMNRLVSALEKANGDGSLASAAGEASGASKITGTAAGRAADTPHAGDTARGGAGDGRQTGHGSSATKAPKPEGNGQLKGGG
ncbi:DotA/TraY family protein [Azospirillum sp.]|uniref:DotA/TraY family protein n=1 Tax=Azospirillum sp. TaxID=34012 RepID=UPI003D7107BE